MLFQFCSTVQRKMESEGASAIVPGHYEIVDLDKLIKKRRVVTDEDRKRIVQCARDGGDMRLVAHHLNINIKTCRGIAARDREGGLKRGFARRKFNDDVVAMLCSIVDNYPAVTLSRMKEMIESTLEGLTISLTSIDRLLDCCGYSMKKLTIQPIERNRIDVKQKRSEHASWLEEYGGAVLRLYIDETNYNIWCSRTRGRSIRSKPCVRTLPSNKGANLNVIACFSTMGIVCYECHARMNFLIFNDLFREMFQ